MNLIKHEIQRSLAEVELFSDRKAEPREKQRARRKKIIREAKKNISKFPALRLGLETLVRLIKKSLFT